MADNIAVTEGSGKNVAADDVGGAMYQRVKVAVGTDGSATDVSSSNPMPITASGGTMAVYFDRSNPSVNIGSPTIAGITNSVAVHVLSTGGTINVALKPGTLAVSLDPGTTLGAISGIGSSVAAHILSTNGTMAVNIGKVDGTVTVRFDPGYTQMNVGTVGAVTNITNSIGVHVLSTGGTLQVKIDPASAGIGRDDVAFVAGTGMGTPMMGFFDDTATDSVDEGDIGVLRMTGNRIQMVHTDSTASIFTVSGSTSGVSASGVTLVAPSASYSFKVYAFSIQTTGVVSCVARFTNGAGSATEFWRALVTSNQTSSAPVGANLSTGGAGQPLFATGVNTTLALHLDTATLVHYSVSYTKESA